MKKLLVLPLILTGALMLGAQPARVYPTAPAAVKPGELPQLDAPPGTSRHPGFSPFNINFPGGPPAKLVQMITNQTQKPLNVIVPPEFTDTELPPLNLSGVTVPQLFEALEQASRRTVTYPMGYGGAFQQYQRGTTGFGFKTTGPMREDSIWYFFVENPGEPPKRSPPEPKKETICRFFQLGPYLQTGLKIEDITTALETAWKMIGESSAPNIKFHQDTKLLIAVGQPDKLIIIDDVLAQLPGAPSKSDRATGLPALPQGGIGGVNSAENTNSKSARP